MGVPSQPLLTAGDESNIFTDIFNVISNWFVNSPLGYLFNVLGGPTSYLAMLEAPAEFVFAIGAFWYGITFFLVIAFFAGRE